MTDLSNADRVALLAEVAEASREFLTALQFAALNEEEFPLPLLERLSDALARLDVGGDGGV